MKKMMKVESFWQRRLSKAVTGSIVFVIKHNLFFHYTYICTDSL